VVADAKKPDDADGPATPVYRITEQWKTNKSTAIEVAERCRAKVRALSMPRVDGKTDMPRASAVGDIAGLLDHYRRRFEDWAEKTVAYEQKEREQRAFLRIVDAAHAELEDPHPAGKRLP
jgi:hypothetical protein